MSIVSTARSLIGKISYAYGSTNIEGGRGDCSAFTQYVFKQNGIDIGRSTQAQYTGSGTTILKEALQPGDLVFFKDTYASGNTNGVSHVGIYSGDGKFIHLGNSGCTESDLSNTYWKAHFLGGKRISGAGSGDSSEAAEASGSSTEIDLDIIGILVKYVVLLVLMLAMLVFLIYSVGLDDEVAKVMTGGILK